MESFVQPTIRRSSGKQRLIAAADKLFSQASFDDVSVAELLEESGLKAPSLYHHFGDKEGLYVAWVKSAIQTTGASLPTYSDEMEPVAMMNAIAETLTQAAPLDVLQIGKDLKNVKSNGKAAEVSRLMQSEIIEPVSKAIALAQKGGFFPEGDLPELTRLFLHSTMFSHPNYAGVNGDLASLGDSTHEVVVAWFCGNLPRSA